MPLSVAVAVMRTSLLDSLSSRSTSTLSRGSGWQRGMSSAVRLAAIMPAKRATGSTSPFSTLPPLMSARVSSCMDTAPLATASRSVSGLWPTSTIRALPCSSI